jgi:hypothetical protein
MMTLTPALARLIPTDLRAKMLLMIDQYLRQNLTDEDLFECWLEEGVPDGTESWKELEDTSIEDFVEMWNLAEWLMSQQAEGSITNDEPDDIDDDTGYNPYMGCMDWDC